MKVFVKLNILAIYYAFIMCIQTVLMVYVYYISRVTGFSIDFTVNILKVASLIIFASSTVIAFFITRKLFGSGKLKYLTTLMWLPYYLIFARLTSIILPITYRGDKPAPGAGLVLMLLIVLYPFYIALINIISANYQRRSDII